MLKKSWRGERLGRTHRETHRHIDTGERGGERQKQRHGGRRQREDRHRSQARQSLRECKGRGQRSCRRHRQGETKIQERRVWEESLEEPDH